MRRYILLVAAILVMSASSLAYAGLTADALLANGAVLDPAGRYLWNGGVYVQQADGSYAIADSPTIADTDPPVVTEPAVTTGFLIEYRPDGVYLIDTGKGYTYLLDGDGLAVARGEYPNGGSIPDYYVSRIIASAKLITEPVVTDPPVVCTMQAKQCPDGSFVSASGPNCEFAACPEISVTDPPVVCTMQAKQCPDGSFVSASGPNCEFATCPEISVTDPPVIVEPPVTGPDANKVYTVRIEGRSIYLVRQDGKSTVKSVDLVPGSVAYDFVKANYRDGATISNSNVSKLLEGTNNQVVAVTPPPVLERPPAVVQPPVVTDPPVIVDISRPVISDSPNTVPRDVLDTSPVANRGAIPIVKDYGIACAHFSGVSARPVRDDGDIGGQQVSGGSREVEVPCREAPQ